jgi:hypothetical protein
MNLAHAHDKGRKHRKPDVSAWEHMANRIEHTRLAKPGTRGARETNQIETCG